MALLSLANGQTTADSLDLDDDFDEVSIVRLVEGALSIHYPVGVFRDKSPDGFFVGGSLAAFHQLKKEQPAFVGAEFAFGHLGSLSRTYEISTGIDVVEVEGKMSSNTISFTAVGRYYSPVRLWAVQPYLEFHFGAKWLYAYLSEAGLFASGESYDNFEMVESEIVPVYGGAMGLQLRVSDATYLLLKGSYQVANSATYRLRIRDDFNVFPLLPEDGFETVRSATSTFRLDIGATLSF